MRVCVGGGGMGTGRFAVCLGGVSGWGWMLRHSRVVLLEAPSTPTTTASSENLSSSCTPVYWANHRQAATCSGVVVVRVDRSESFTGLL